jgi:hypothetical protein
MIEMGILGNVISGEDGEDAKEIWHQLIAEAEGWA